MIKLHRIDFTYNSDTNSYQFKWIAGYGVIEYDNFHNSWNAFSKEANRRLLAYAKTVDEVKKELEFTFNKTQLNNDLFAYRDMLHPESYISSELDDYKMKCKLFFEAHMYEVISLKMFYNHFLNKKVNPDYRFINEYETEMFRKAQAANAHIGLLFDKDITGDTIIDDYAEIDHYRMIRDGLSEMHFGHCTGHNNECNRCHSERMYDLKSTVNWSKNQGKQIYDDYFELKKITEEKQKHTLRKMIDSLYTVQETNILCQ